MLGLVYLTSVACLIATTSVMHQLSLSRSSQSLLQPPVEIGLPHLPTSSMDPEAPAPAPAPAPSLPCCDLANKSLNHQTSAFEFGQHLKQDPPSASAPTSVLCLWGSLLASVGHIHPEMKSEDSQSWSVASFISATCLATLPPLPCGLRNTSSIHVHGHLDNHEYPASWPSSSPPGAAKPNLNSNLGAFPPLQMRSCNPESILPVDKVQALLMPG